MLTEDQIKEIFLKADAFLEGHFLLSSGLHSPYYLQCARVLQYPDYAETLCRELARRIKEPDPESLKVVQQLIDDSYRQFVEAVAQGRKIPVEKVREFADGRIFTGRRAKELGLVDYLGGLDRAVEVARELSGYPNAVEYEVKEKKGLLERLMGQESSESMGKIFKVLRGEVEEVKLMYLLN